MANTEKKSSSDNPLWTAAVYVAAVMWPIICAFIVDDDTPQPEPLPTPVPVIVDPVPVPTPTPEQATVLHSYVVDPAGNVIDPVADESVPHFTWLAKNEPQGAYAVHSVVVGRPPSSLPITIGTGSPGPGPPGPVPPNPPTPPTPPIPPVPPVVDTFFSDVKNAYTADAPYNAVALDQLIKGYAVAVIAIDDRSNDSIGKLYSAVNIAVRNAAGGESLPNTRTALAKEADRVLPKSGVVDEQVRLKIKAQFMRAKSALEACK